MSSRLCAAFALVFGLVAIAPGEASAQAQTQMQAPTQSTYLRYEGQASDVWWGSLGFGARFKTGFNIPRGQFLMGGGAVIRLHPVSYPSASARWMPLELEMEIGYDRYLGTSFSELSYGGSAYLYASARKVQPYLVVMLGRSLGQDPSAHEVRWTMGGGFGVGYRTRRFFLGGDARGGGIIGGKYTPWAPGAQGIVEVRLMGIVYVL